jgi:hypothetical protein
MNNDRPIIVLCWFTRGDYDAHLVLDPKDMKPRFDQWLKDAEAHEQDLKAHGYIVHRVMVDSKKLLTWATLSGVKIDATGRARYAHQLFIQGQMN